MTYEHQKAFGTDMYTEGGVFDVASPHDDRMVATPHDDLTVSQVLPPPPVSDLQPVPSTLSTPETPPVLFTNGNGNGNGNGRGTQVTNGAATTNGNGVAVQHASMVPITISWKHVGIAALVVGAIWMLRK